MKKLIAGFGLFVFFASIAAVSGAAEKKENFKPKEPGLAAYWNFDEDKGISAKDLSGNGSNIEFENEWTKGKVNSALLFDGEASIIQIVNEVNFNFEKAFTIMAWVKLNDQGEYQTVFNNNQFFLRKDSPGEGSRLSIFVRTEDGVCEPRASTEESIETDKWYHVAATWDGNTAKMYLGGEIQAERIRPGPLASQVMPTIGGGQMEAPNCNGWIGIIDELKIYNRALSGKEIKDYYNSTK